MNFFKKATTKTKLILENFVLFFISLFIIFNILFYSFNNLQDNTEISILELQIIVILILIVFSLMTSIIIYKKCDITNKLDLAFQIFSDAKEAIIITNEKTEIIYANNSFSRITGYKVDDVIGKKTSTFKSGKHSKVFYEKMWNSIKKNGHWQGQVWDRKRNGELYPKFLRISLVKSNIDNKIKYIGVFEDLTELKDKKEKIRKLKYFDSLTDLPNIELLNKIITREIKNLKSENILTLISIKIINFNIINDTFGNNIGNELLIDVINSIKSLLNKNDTLCKMGKDEFAILIKSNHKLDNLFNISDQLLSSLNKVFIISNKEILINTAIGLSIYNEEIDGCKQLIETANIAREHSFQQCGSCYEFYKKDIKENYISKINLISDLRNAIDNNEFTLYYQPQVDIISGKIVGMEALVRWNSPKLGLVPPIKFIPLAEETGLIVPIGNWILEEAIKQTKELQENGHDNLIVAVNISPIQFQSTNIIETIKNLLKKYDLSGKYLEVEITEGLLMKNIDTIKEDLMKIKEMSIKIAIDDFGTGYSSLSYLRKLNIDKIKIDREFVKDYPEKDDGTIAKTIVNLAENLNLNVITEGVENDSQLEFIKNIGCNLVQGYYYSPPVTFESFKKLL